MGADSDHHDDPRSFLDRLHDLLQPGPEYEACATTSLTTSADHLSLFGSQVAAAAALALKQGWLDATVADAMALDAAAAQTASTLAHYYAVTERHELSSKHLADARGRLREAAAHLRDVLRARLEDAPGDSTASTISALLERLPPRYSKQRPPQRGAT